MSALREFLNAGRIGNVQPGLRPEQVESILGPAEDRSVKRTPVYLLRYGAVEFAFKPIPGTKDSRLVSTAVYLATPGRSIPDNLRLSDWDLAHRASAADVHRLLEREGLTARSSTDGEQEYLTLDSGASIVLVNGKVHSIHFKNAGRKPERKQITVSLPEETVQKLQHRAQAEQVSVPNLIEKMIEAAC